MLGANQLNEIEEIRKNDVRLKSRIPARIFAEIPRELRIAPEALNKRIEGAPWKGSPDIVYLVMCASK